ncbi:unnamed protein product [Trichobilharzia szidati]|nr:unnamed protein product [Trichobilharzia szidati]
MEIGPNLCIWPVQSGINNHENEHGYELKSITKNISPIIQQNNSSFIYNHKNDILELESDSDIDNEIESTNHIHPPPAHPPHPPHSHNDRDQHKQHQQYSHPSYQNHHQEQEQHHEQHHQQQTTYDHLHGVHQCQSSHWDTTKLINLSIDENDTDEINSVIIEDIDSNENNHNSNNLHNDDSLYDEQSLSINEKHYHHHHQNNTPYDLHQKNIQNKDYTCGFCGHDFDTPEQVEKHVLIKHSDHLIHFNENKTINSTNTTTTTTATNTNTTDILDKSVVLIDEQKKININNNTGLLQKDAKKLSEKDKLLTTILNSSISDTQTDDLVSMRNNNNNKDVSTPIMNPMITDCPLCDRTFVGRRSLNIHLNKTHSIRENNNSNCNNNNSMDTTNTTVSVSNATKMMNNTNSIDIEQSKCNSQMKLTRLSHSYSLKGNNRSLNSNKVFTESLKSSSNEKSSCKIAVRPPLLPRPSRIENSAIHTSVSSSQSSNMDYISANNLLSTSSDISISKSSDSEESSLQKSRRTVYAVSPPLAKEHSGLKLRLISLDAVKKSTNTNTKLQNSKNNYIDKTQLIDDLKSISPVYSSPSSSSITSIPATMSTHIPFKKSDTVTEEDEQDFSSSNTPSLRRTVSVHTTTNDEHCNASQSNTFSFHRSQSCSLDMKEAYKFAEDENANMKYDFSNDKRSSLQLNFEQKNGIPCEFSFPLSNDDDNDNNNNDKTQKKSETMDTSLRTSDGLYKCRICKRLFANRYSLTGHYKSHYEPSQKPYCCDDCGQRYTSPSNLHYHRGRNCPVLKLKAIREGKLIPTSIHNTKLLELKALRAVERKALMNKLKDQNDSNNNNNSNNNNSNNEIKDTTCDSNRHHPPAQKKSRFNDTKAKNHLTTLKTDSSIECLDGNFMLQNRQKSKSCDTSQSFNTSTIITTSSSNSSSTNTVVNTTVDSNINNNNENSTIQNNEDGLQMQEILRLFLMHAYQSDELRQQLVSLTSSALLNALVPTNGFHHSSMLANQTSTSNQQLFNLLSSVINSSNSIERNSINSVNNNSNHTQNDATDGDMYMHNKSTVGRVLSQPANSSPLIEEPTDLTSRSSRFVQHKDQGINNACGIHCSMCCHDSIIFPDYQALNKHMFLVHGKYPRSSTGTTGTPPPPSSVSTPTSTTSFLRCHSMTESLPSNTDWNMRINNSSSTSNSDILIQQLHRYQQDNNYSTSDNNSNNTDQSSSSPSIISQWNSKPSSLVSCTDCDREFSTYTAFRVHHTKSHQQSSSRHQHQHHQQQQQQAHHHQSQYTKSRLRLTDQGVPTSLSNQCDVTYVSDDNDSE